MKIFISADMEGITGVVDWNQVDGKDAEYQRFRERMTEDVNAAVEGAFKCGATEVLVTDAHGSKTNILIEKLFPGAMLVSGPTSPMAMVQGLDDSFDAAMFIGYHARKGTKQAVLAHTISSNSVQNVWINDRLVGEFGLNAAVCGHYGVPVILVSSDDAGCKEGQDWIPGITTVETKRATGRFSAACKSQETTLNLIKRSTQDALKAFMDNPDAVKPLVVDTPINIRVMFMNADMADKAENLPGVSRVDDLTISVTADSMPQAYLFMRAAIRRA